MTIFKPLQTAELVCFLSVFLIGSSLATSPPLAQSNNNATSVIGARARAIQESAIVVDTHADTPQRFLDGNFDIGSTDPADVGHISLDKARAGNLGAEFFSIWVDPETNQGHFAQHTFDLIDSVYEQASHHPDRMMMAFSVEDIEHAHKAEKACCPPGDRGRAFHRERYSSAARFLSPRRTLHDAYLVEHE